MEGARAVRPPAHVALRESTRAAHDAAEASPLMQRLLAGALDETAYRALLAAQWHLLSEWEAERSAWLAGIGVAQGWHYASRVEALARDLEDLSHPACDNTLVGARPARDIFSRKAAGPVAHGPNSCRAQGALLQGWGELYVIEGSALGGRVIVKRLRERFPALAHRFYAIGENTKAPWHRFQGLLDRMLAEPAALRSAVEGALRMFARYQQTLKDHASHV
ncbi:biliverdin-producing heme oxygenase [Luteibacter jiangsuensis]|uniref:Biliverdin-producing heme oxygenase n=1 Tax=Luteibacter jiangsuensis TaxID=637577 RepID=A0ABX0Q7S4_9GAMM|nr:biliverdin-producing heme oxygenase [Luteibacter jiangsuensis]